MDVYQENITPEYQQYFEDDFNVIIYAGEEPNVTEFHAHSIILRYRSQYFRTALSSSWAEKMNGMYILKKPNISGNIFQIILRYIYSGVVNFSQIGRTEHLELLKAADELAFDRIKDYCIEIICRKTEILFENEKFLTTPPQILELLLQQDKLALEEIDIWDYLIKWAYAQNPTIELDPSKWSKDDIEIMKRTADYLISLIRFHNISSNDYVNKIMPYKKLLPKNIKDQFYSISNSRSPELNSSLLITQKDLYHSLFLNWINKKDLIYRSRNILRYEFKLILRGSRDGFDGNTFHSKCNNKGATIMIAKIKDSKKIIGGYNPLDWNGSGFKDTSDSFIFSFDDYRDVNTGKIGRVIESRFAIRCLSNYGPLFGTINSKISNDIMMTPSGRWGSAPNSYPDLNIPCNFKIDNYEVFQVIKK
ncbi:hypothetical protein C1645_801750 [Glomus cerebriforme]|uniref:BTB/POZ domain-containing protein n=1 Tax=Glomus cerebriforme TaxID=658196 RepID=A0A397TRQ5_9GLOM|nr:hypothetical protein C1645_801750 [Glomus cerebriforme]